MKLFPLAMWRTSVALVVILAAWAAFFYVAIMEEVTDETDDSLEDYSEWIIRRALAGETLPSADNGSNNQYYLHAVSAAYAESRPWISYRDAMVYLDEKGEDEPARVLTTIFRTDNDEYRELVVYTPNIEKYDLRRALLGWIVFLYVALLLMLLLLNAWIFRRNMRPLYRLLTWLKQYRLGTSHTPPENNTRITEFRLLNEAALQATQRSEKLYEQQRLFIGNASHEMQTPLAICCNRLESLMEEEGLTERQLSELVKTHQTLEHLSRMNRSLLLLCKIENGQFNTSTPICLNDVLRHYLDDYQEVYAYRNIRMSVEEQGRFVATLDESLATILVTNLLKNAFVHTPPEGDIRITFTNDSFQVENTGSTALDEKHIFECFYQGDKKEGSTGLGLALVNAICKTNRLDIHYTFRNGYHCFEVRR